MAAYAFDVCQFAKCILLNRSQNRQGPQRSPPPVIPQVRVLAAAQSAAVAENHLGQKSKVLPQRVKPHLARRRHERVTVQNDNSPALPARHFFQPLAQFQFLRHEQFVIEPTDFVAIGSSGYFGAHLSVMNGSHKVSSSQPVGVGDYGFGLWDACGYFGGVVK